MIQCYREVWPDGDVFGAADTGPEDEFMALREIHFTNLNGKTCIFCEQSLLSQTFMLCECRHKANNVYIYHRYKNLDHQNCQVGM